MIPSAADMHVTLLCELHVAVTHAAADSIALVVKSPLAKFRPLTVTDDPPLSAAFTMATDPLGASKLKSPNHVPATAPTVTNAKSSGSRPSGVAAPPRHPTDVLDVHDDVKHCKPSKTELLVNEATPKPRPVTVTEERPVRGALVCS
jgi:hypothetical protein